MLSTNYLGPNKLGLCYRTIDDGLLVPMSRDDFQNNGGKHLWNVLQYKSSFLLILSIRSSTNHSYQSVYTYSSSYLMRGLIYAFLVV